MIVVMDTRKLGPEDVLGAYCWVLGVLGVLLTSTPCLGKFKILPSTMTVQKLAAHLAS